MASPFGFLRKLVSQNKQRHVEDGFDLDLTYLTEQMICMGLPAEGTERYYRNPIEQVVQFLEKRHAGNYKVFNLCNERSYDISHFGDACASFPFDDHSAPQLAMIGAFCASAKAWLAGGMERVVVIHCKAGKGRTGCMACSLLMHLGFERTAQSAIAFYDHRRTRDGKGLTSPSQRRYVGYYERVLASEWHEGVERSLTGVALLNAPSRRPSIVVTISHQADEAAGTGERLSVRLTAARGAPSGAMRDVACEWRARSDLKIELADGETGGLLARLWIHPAFEPPCARFPYLGKEPTRSQLDLPTGIRRRELKLEGAGVALPEGFALELRFAPLQHAGEAAAVAAPPTEAQAPPSCSTAAAAAAATAAAAAAASAAASSEQQPPGSSSEGPPPSAESGSTTAVATESPPSADPDPPPDMPPSGVQQDAAGSASQDGVGAPRVAQDRREQGEGVSPLATTATPIMGSDATSAAAASGSERVDAVNVS